MEGTIVTASPSFRDIPAIHQHPHLHSPYHYVEAGNSSEEEFEFALVLGHPGSEEILSSAPDYPVFGRDLLRKVDAVEEDDRDELQGLAKRSYCLWTPRSVPPSPERWVKSSSTGSEGRRWRLRDLVAGRSRSDGKEKFFVVGSEEEESNSKSKEKKKGVKVIQTDLVTAYKACYGKGQRTKGRRQLFLPYRPVLVGFFSRRLPF